jgi:glucose-1-phosphate thymidylyltransferase
VRAIILAAGYGTRLGELGKRTPKALLPVAGRPVLGHLLEHLARIGVQEGLLVTNARFDEAFRAWHAGSDHPVAVDLLCDGSTEPDNRLGAVRDLALGLERVPEDEAVFVTASDNLYTADLAVVVNRFEEMGAPIVALIREEETAKLRRSGVATVAEDGRLLSFLEKPEQPPSPYASPPLYVYPPDIREDIRSFLADPAVDHDAPGNLVAYIVDRRPVYGVILEGRRYDIGSLESYEEARRVFEAGDWRLEAGGRTR